MCFCPQAGWTALHTAARIGRKVDVVGLLIDAGAHVDIPAKVSTSPYSHYMYVVLHSVLILHIRMARIHLDVSFILNFMNIFVYFLRMAGLH